MDDRARTELLGAFRAFLGDERFLRFAVAIEERSAEDLVWWQQRAIADFNASHPKRMPTSPAELRALFVGVMPHVTMDASSVPAWCVIEFLGGSAPVQGWGTCDGYSWYFRARSGRWTIGVAPKGVDPVDVESSDSGAFFHEESFGDRRYSASYMPLDEARHFIVRELTRFRIARGPG